MRILFLAHLKSVVGRPEIELRCDGVDTDALWSKLIELHPALAQFRSAVRLARNSEYVGPEARFYQADEVALIPPVSGG
jgi:molybdopterin converting factor small subunit